MLDERSFKKLFNILQYLVKQNMCALLVLKQSGSYCEAKLLDEVLNTALLVRGEDGGARAGSRERATRAAAPAPKC
jgi:hypothetical protein